MPASAVEVTAAYEDIPSTSEDKPSSGGSLKKDSESSSTTKPNITVYVKPEKNAPTSGIINTLTEVADKVFTKDEIKTIDNGEIASVYITVEEISETISIVDKVAVKNAIKSHNKADNKDKLFIAMYVDISLFKEVGSSKNSIAQN